jgi:hypothetical protein
MPATFVFLSDVDVSESFDLNLGDCFTIFLLHSETEESLQLGGLFHV